MTPAEHRHRRIAIIRSQHQGRQRATANVHQWLGESVNSSDPGHARRERTRARWGRPKLTLDFLDVASPARVGLPKGASARGVSSCCNCWDRHARGLAVRGYRQRGRSASERSRGF